jgi:hypothetical protein
MEANTVSALTEFLVNFLLGVWSCVSITFLISMIQNIVSERKREKRDLEYHEARMKEYNK